MPLSSKYGASALDSEFEFPKDDVNHPFLALVAHLSAPAPSPRALVSTDPAHLYGANVLVLNCGCPSHQMKGQPSPPGSEVNPHTAAQTSHLGFLRILVPSHWACPFPILVGLQTCSLRKGIGDRSERTDREGQLNSGIPELIKDKEVVHRSWNRENLDLMNQTLTVSPKHSYSAFTMSPRQTCSESIMSPTPKHTQSRQHYPHQTHSESIVSTYTLRIYIALTTKHT